MIEKKKLSIIIVTYNSKKLIYQCLDSVFEHNDIGDLLEVIIVDNCSKDQDELFAELRTFYKDKIKLIKNTNNGGYGQGNNIGIDSSSAPYIMIINPDVVLYKPIFKKQIATFESDKKTGIIGLQQYENHSFQKNDSFIVNMPTIRNLFLHKIYRKLNIFTTKYFCFSGACFFLRKTSFLEAGKFDERIFLYGEETDLQYRIIHKSASNRIFFNKDDGYIHPSHDRDLEFKSHVEGFKSFLVLGESQRISRQKMKEKMMKYYKFLSWYFKFKDVKMATFYKDLIPKLEGEYNSIKDNK